MTSVLFLASSMHLGTAYPRMHEVGDFAQCAPFHEAHVAVSASPKPTVKTKQSKCTPIQPATQQSIQTQAHCKNPHPHAITANTGQLTSWLCSKHRHSGRRAGLRIRTAMPMPCPASPDSQADRAVRPSAAPLSLSLPITSLAGSRVSA